MASDSPISLGWLASKSQIVCLQVPSFEITSTCHHACLLDMDSGDQTQIPTLAQQALDSLSCLSNLFFKSLMEIQQLEGPQRSLWNQVLRKTVPFTQGGHLGKQLGASHAFLHALPAGALDSIIFSSRLCCLCHEGGDKHPLLSVRGSLLNRFIFLCPSEMQAKQGLYLQRLNIPLIGLLAFQPQPSSSFCFVPLVSTWRCA